MHITIAQRFRPFSHQAGTQCLLPGSSYTFQIFPCLIRIQDLSIQSSQPLIEYQLNLQGPVQDFTVMQDLEKGWIRVWGHAQNGYVRYRFRTDQKGREIQLYVEKSPDDGLLVTTNHHSVLLQAQEALSIMMPSTEWEPFVPPSIDRLALGSHQTLDWDLVRRRLDLKEILPVWYRLGQLVPANHLTYKETTSLFKQCQMAIEETAIEAIGSSLLHLFQAGFKEMLLPRLFDDHYQGFAPIFVENASTSPLVLLSEGVPLIRSLFIQTQKDRISILPALPAELSSGRLTHTPVSKGFIDLEWSKKWIRRLIFDSHEEQVLTFHFKHVKAYRLRSQKNEKGLKCLNQSTLHFKKNVRYFFDNFT
jgi:hypothetical protein